MNGDRSVLLLSVAVTVAGLVLIGILIGLAVLLDPVP